MFDILKKSVHGKPFIYDNKLYKIVIIKKETLVIERSVVNGLIRHELPINKITQLKIFTIK
ncbi:MAG: hypothetical protein KAT68_00615 [Bacteroidales bacterium]|nr:hypothetical protein [Bacteroidales bacterium]